MNKKEIKYLELIKSQSRIEMLSNESLSESDKHKLNHQYRMAGRKRNPMEHLKLKKKKRKK